MLRVIFAVSWNQHGRKNGAFHSLVVVGVDADLLLLGTKRKLAAFQWFQFMVALQVGPAPHAAVDDMGQSLPVGDLQSAIQRTGNGDTVTRLPWATQGLLQLLHGTFLFLQFFHQSIDSFLSPFLLLIALFPPQKSLHSWAREGEQTCHIHGDRSGSGEGEESSPWTLGAGSSGVSLLT